jgi:PIN domain nuclease of toxin-antitoxin system
MAIQGIADTHTLIWYLYNDSRLSQIAYGFLDSITESGHQIAIASISLAELIYLTERKRIHQLAFERVIGALEQENGALIEVPFNRSVAMTMRQIERAEVPELPDRIIAATALLLDVPVISRDHKIRASAVTSIW